MKLLIATEDRMVIEDGGFLSGICFGVILLVVGIVLFIYIQSNPLSFILAVVCIVVGFLYIRYATSITLSLDTVSGKFVFQNKGIRNHLRKEYALSDIDHIELRTMHAFSPTSQQGIDPSGVDHQVVLILKDKTELPFENVKKYWWFGFGSKKFFHADPEKDARVAERVATFLGVAFQQTMAPDPTYTRIT